MAESPRTWLAVSPVDCGSCNPLVPIANFGGSPTNLQYKGQSKVGAGEHAPMC